MSFDPNEPAGVFTSRWWGIVSTVYLVLAPLTIVIGVTAYFLSVFDESGAPRPVFFELLFWVLAPMFLGFIVATGIEFRRKTEPPLARGPFVRRTIRILFGFCAPFFLAWAILAWLTHVSRA